ncbi:MAG TPA: ABC transporter substrate-binding protein, partial [Candidatus Saccharimonadales bacterium]|nr:ABC transporter substrate-binding protein [Candidatus Saccharimonadales bacterium]
RIYNLPLTAATMVFFRNSAGVLSDATVRKALVQAADPTSIIANLDYSTLPVREPLLHGQVGYNPLYQQAGYNTAAAAALLDGDGWVMGGDGLRHKGGQTLSFQLQALDSGDYPQVAKQLVQQWRAVGAKAQLITQDATTFQNALSYHTYDAILYGISIGVDPDVFVYWDSSQGNVLAPVRLNLSEWHSAQADTSLEAGRTRLDPALRAIKYQPFLQAWQADAPALGLYQPRFLYITRGTVYGLSEHAINSDVDRFTNVQNWEIRRVKRADT